MTDTQRNWERFALLLIDVQRDFWSERAAHVHPDFPATIAAQADPEVAAPAGQLVGSRRHLG